MPKILTTEADPGFLPSREPGLRGTTWVDSSSVLAEPSIAAAALRTITTPDNVFPQDLFAGEAASTVTVPSDGDWLVHIYSSISRNGAVSGTLLQSSVLLQASVHGVGQGSIGIRILDTDQVSYPHVLTVKLVGLSAGDTVGARWGFGGAQATSTLSASAGTTLHITPTQA